MSMKTCVIWATILIVYANADDIAKLKELMDTPEAKKCIESSGFKPDATDLKEITPEKLCFLKCVMEEKGVLDADGKIRPEAVNEAPISIPDDKKEEIIRCAAEAGAIKTCDDVAKVFQCIPH